MDGKWDGPESVGGAARLSRVGGSGGGVWMGGALEGGRRVGGGAAGAAAGGMGENGSTE